MSCTSIKNTAWLLCSLLFTTTSLAQTLSDQNQRYKNDITAIGIAHGVSTVAGIFIPPPADKIAEIQEYGLNIGLKFMPAVLEAPPNLVLRPDAGQCSFTYRRSAHGPDPVVSYENMYGLVIDPVNDWGLLDNASLASGSDDQAPELLHYNTGAWLTIRRSFVNLDGTSEMDGNVPRKRILFADTNLRSDVTRGNAAELASETFNMGTTALYWETENKLDGLFDVLLDPIIFFAELKHGAKKAAQIKKAKRYGRVWDDAAVKWAKSLESSLGREIGQQIVKKLSLFGIDFAYNKADFELTSIPTNVFNRQTQLVQVLDEVAPTITTIRQPDTFEATTLGGERAQRHFAELRDLVEASDNCDRPVRLDSQPIGTRFWPVGKTTTLQWCGRDLGPTSATGGFNRSCTDIFVTVEDTLPPLIVPPPAINQVTSSSQSLEIGRPGVFDVADPDVMVMNDAPAVFPVGRTPVTWTATDSSGNSATATQWVSLKESNAAPVTSVAAAVDAVSFEKTRIELQASDDDSLDGRFDQLGFRIADTPDNGFFVAPLFPFFIEDHRSHRINPDGSYSSFSGEQRRRCEDGEVNNENPIVTDVIIDPQYISVNDDGEVYVLDKYHGCSTGSGDFRTNWRFAKFTPGADGGLEFASQHSLSGSPSDNDRHIFIDHLERIWYVPFEGGNAIVVLDKNLQQVMRLPFIKFTETNVVTGNEQVAFRDAPGSKVQSVVIDRNDVLYLTDGSKMIAYDLQTVIPADAAYGADRYQRLATVFDNAPSGTPSDAEPYASYASLAQGGYLSLAIDSDGNVYASDGNHDRVWKFRATGLSPDRDRVVQAPDVVGWIGRCESNLDPAVLACDTGLQTSIGFACQDDLCGVSDDHGSSPGQFLEQRGATMAPNDILYVADTGNRRVQRFTTDGFFAGEAVSECGGGCFVLGDFGYVTNVAVNSNFFYLLDRDQNLTHIFETTPITDIDDQTLERQQSAFVTYQSKNNFTGIDSFSFFASDGLAESNEAQVTINVSRNFRAPFATANIAVTTNEDEPVAVPLSGLDPDNDMLDFLISQDPANGSIEKVNGEYIYTPDANWYGEDILEFVATDAPGSVPALESAPERVVITVNPVNDSPQMVVEQSFVAGAGYLMKIEFYVTDPDIDDLRRVAVSWGDGAQTASDSDDIVISNSPGRSHVVAEHIYTSAGEYTLTTCTSDAENGNPLLCSAPDVSQSIFSTATVSPAVDIVTSVTDSLPKQEDPDIEGLMVAAPLLDGEPVSYTYTIINDRPESDFPLAASNVELKIAVPAEMEYLSVDLFNGICTPQPGLVVCRIARIDSGDSRDITVNMRAAGTLLADDIATVSAEVTTDQPEHGIENNVVSAQTRLLYNGDLDADGDGVANRNDAFPGDIAEWLDTDGDGTGNNADFDDDGDTLPDSWEQRYGSDPLLADADADSDGDGLDNGEEFAKGTRPDSQDSDADTVADDSDNCAVTWNRRQFDANGNGIGSACDVSERVAATGFGDLDGSGADDIAMLRSVAGVATVFVKDSATNLSVATIATSAREPLRLLGSNDLDGTSRAALVLIEGIAGQPRALLFEAATGNAIADWALAGNGRVVDAVLDGQGGATRLASLYQDDGNVAAVLQDAADGSAQATLDFFSSGYKALALAATDSGIAVLAIAPNGHLHLQIRERGNAALVSSTKVSSGDWLDASLLGSGASLIVTLHNLAGENIAMIVDTQSGAVTSSLAAADAGERLLRTALPGNDLLAALAANAEGELTLRYFSLPSGDIAGTAVQVAAGRSPRALYLQGSDIDTTVAGVATATATGEVFVERYEANSGTSLAEVSATSDSPPPPPPPPPPTDDGGSGGGGPAGWLLLFCIQLALRRKSPVGTTH